MFLTTVSILPLILYFKSLDHRPTRRIESKAFLKSIKAQNILVLRMLYSIQLIQVKRICCQLLNASYKHQLGCNSAVSSMKSVRQLLRLAVNSLPVQLKSVIGR